MINRVNRACRAGAARMKWPEPWTRATLVAAALTLIGISTGLAQGKPATMTAASADPGPSHAVRASDQEIATFFDRYMAAKMTKLEAPGGAMVVVRNGRTILAKGYGVADLRSRQAVNVDRTLFRAASASKILPWLLTMQLAEEGRLNLDRDVNAYLDFTIPEAFGRPITMRHLLTHSAGFPEHFHGLFDANQSVPLGERLRENIPERVYAPGSTVSYSNYGAALAGYIVERLRGSRWEQVVKARLFGPLGMNRSTVSQPVPSTLKRDLASTYFYGSDRPEVFRTSLAPMGALTASPTDMGKLLLLLMNRGRIGERRILGEATVDRMLSLQQPLAPGLPDGLGLGLMVGSYRGVRFAGHAGNMSSLATDLELLPEHGLGWYYVFNSQGPAEQARHVRDDLLKVAITSFAAPTAAPIRRVAGSSAKDVAGSYLSSRRIHSGPLMFSALLNTTKVTAEQDGSLSIESSGFRTRWIPTGPDRFAESKTGIPLVAQRNGKGKVTRFASAALYPVAVFDRAPILSQVVPFWAAISFGTMLIALLVKPFARFRRQRRRVAGPAYVEEREARSARLRHWARISYWLMMVTILAWIAFGVALAIDFTFLFEGPRVIRYALGSLTLLMLPLSLVVAADGVLASRDPGSGLILRTARILLGVGAVSVATLLYTLDVTNMTVRW